MRKGVDRQRNVSRTGRKSWKKRLPEERIFPEKRGFICIGKWYRIFRLFPHREKREREWVLQGKFI